jgi:Toprim-like
MAAEREQVRIVDFYTEVVLPALAERLDQAFPEFGWRRDARGWIATNEEHTHGRLGVRAERVVAHGPAPRGFLVHGGEPMLWTAYLAGGAPPRGAEFARVIAELADRAGVDSAPIERETPRDRKAELLEEFFKLAQRELVSDRGHTARGYLEHRGFAVDAIETSALGVVPSFALTERALRASSYSDNELKASGLFVDGRWPGRLCGAWRNEWGRIGTFWARAVEDAELDAARYLYLRGAARTNLPPYGLQRGVRELVLVEGFFDHHQLRAHEVENSAAIGGTATNPRLYERLSRLGVHEVTLCFDADDAGRAATARAVETAARAVASPTIFVARPSAKDPDELVRVRGIEAWSELLQSRECGVGWRATDLLADVGSTDVPVARRQALARAGSWLGSLPPRLALEQEDAVRIVAERCGYSAEAVERAFRARFFRDVMADADESPGPKALQRRMESTVDF